MQLRQIYGSYLRSIFNFRTRFYRTERCKQSIKSSGLTKYNKIPNDIREINSIKLFKTNITVMVIGKKNKCKRMKSAKK